MGLRFRKSIKIAPGVKLNLNKKSTSISFGGKRAGVTVNSKRGMSYRVSAPGTGLSYTGKIGGSSKKESNYLYTDYDYDDSYEDYDVDSPSAGYSSYHSFSVAPDPGPTLFQRMFDPEYFVPETWFGVVGYCLRYGVLPILVFLHLLFYAKPIYIAIGYGIIRCPAVYSCIEIVNNQKARTEK